jgi:hypothetical protein
VTGEATPQSGAVTMPATEMLRTVLPALDGAGIAAAVGGSGILAAPGLAGHVRDWDLQQLATKAGTEQETG